MFLENTGRQPGRKGWIEVISGSMFSGKTEELIRRLRRAEIAKLNVKIYKPKLDKRYHADYVVSHDENSIKSIAVNSSSEILPLASDIDVVGIDEAQFFDNGLPEVCNQLANEGARVVVTGLDMDFLGKPFGPMPGLMAVAEYVTKVHAICVQCGDLANHSHRITDDDSLVVLGELNAYEPLCRNCFHMVTESEKSKVSELDQSREHKHD